jgi:transposase
MEKLLIGYAAVAKHIGCSYQTIVRMKDKGHMPTPHQTIDGVGRGKRHIWTENQLEKIKEIILTNQKTYHHTKRTP